MIAPATLKNAFDALKMAAESGMDAASLLLANESLISKNKEIAQSSNKAFYGYESVSSADLTEAQKNLLNYQYDYMLPDCSTSLRKTVSDAIDYYINKDYNDRQFKQLSYNCDERWDKIREYKEEIAKGNEELALKDHEISQLTERVDCLAASNAELIKRNEELVAEINALKSYNDIDIKI
jgi:hypothetical protein